MRTLNCLIIDDEPIAREGIRDYCNKVPFFKVMALCKNVLQANHYLQIHQIDVIFLDINMPLISGIDWLKSLKKSPAIIMTTAYETYALESFQYNVIDYLVKPISLERFLQAAHKLNHFHEKGRKDDILFLKSEKLLRKVFVDDILFVEALQNYVKVVTNKEVLMVHMTLKTLKKQLPDYFIQTHKSYVVSKYKIDMIKENHIHVGNHKIPISVRLKKKVLDRLK